MLNISKYFKRDILSTNQTLKPVIVITDPNTDEILFTLTQDADKLYTSFSEGYYTETFYATESLKTINCLSKVSNVKISNDYDSKKLKINRLRCTLYNYYDVKTKITEYIDNSIIGKNMYLFYKSPTTNIISFTGLSSAHLGYECALIYRGEINRIDFNNNTINISAEDRTQIKISNKTVPYMSIDKLSPQIQDNILPEYKEDDTVVPMTFGAVDKAPVMPYIDFNNERIMNLLVDIFPTSSHYKTSKIPNLLHNGTIRPEQNDYYLYIKAKDDYIILDHALFSVPYLNQLYSQIKLTSIRGFNNNYILPELQPEEEDSIFKQWDMGGFYQRQVNSAYASDGSVLDISSIQLEEISNTDFINEESIHNNNNYPKIWYRASDTLISGPDHFDTSMNVYDSATAMGAGRWIILKLEEGVDSSLLNIKIDGDWAGNTFLACDYELIQNIGDTSNSEHIPSDADRTGFFVAPISSEIWGNIIPDAIGPMSGVSGFQALANIIMCRNASELEVAETLIETNLQELNTPMSNFYENAPIYCLKDEAVHSENKYWGLSGSFDSDDNSWNNINGLYYGDTGNQDNQVAESADSHKALIVFEYFPPYWSNNYSYRQRLRMNNIGLVHSVKVDDITQEKMFASIVGRKNHLFTEQLNPETYTDAIDDIDIPLTYLINGPDDSLPDFDVLLDSLYNVICNTFDSQLPTWDTNGDRLDYINKDVIDEFLDAESWETVLATSFQQELGSDDSPIFRNYGFFKNFIWKSFLLPARLLHYMGALESAVKESEGLFTNQFMEMLQYNSRKQMLNFNQILCRENWVKSILKNILEYIYQTEIDYTEDYTIDCWWVDDLTVNSDFAGEHQMYYIQDSRQTTVSMTDTITNARQYSWNSLPNEINTFDDWIDNFYVYMDDLFQAIHTGLCTEYQSRINQNEWIYGTGDPYWIDQYNANLDEFADSHSWILGISSYDEDNSALETLKNEILILSAQNYGVEDDSAFTTDGIIQKPCDIVMNILTNEMEYAKYDSLQTAGNSVIIPDYNEYDIDSLLLSRAVHAGWKMGFSLDKKKDGKKLIEEILKESKSYPRFNNAGKFGFINIKNSYNYNDIDKILDINDIIKYRFTETKREDVITSVKMFYRYDYGHKKYRMNIQKSISNYLSEYLSTGYSYYNLNAIDGHKDIKLKYHTDTYTVDRFMEYTLLNNCNTHNIVEMTLPLSYMDLTVSDIIHIPLINNEKIFDIDYSVVDYKNSQPIYPLWLILETNIGIDSIKIKAYQLHYLGIDGNHGFVDIETSGDEEYGLATVGNTEQFSNWSFTNGQPIPYINYDPNATIDSGIRILYFDLNLDGGIDNGDLIRCMNLVNGEGYSEFQAEQMKYNADGTLNEIVGDIGDAAEIIEIINYNGDNP